MSQLKIRRAFEKKLKELDSNFPTAYENVSFDPVEGMAYQRVQLVPFSPENPTYGDGYHREVGEFQIFLCYPLNKGTQDAYVKAEAIKQLFKRATTLNQEGIQVIVLKTPAIAGGLVVNDRYILPIRIEYYVNELN